MRIKPLSRRETQRGIISTSSKKASIHRYLILMGLLGDATGDHFYIIEEGEYKLTQSALYVINGFIRSLVWGVHVRPRR